MLGFLQRKVEHARIEQIRQLGLFSTLNARELRVIDDLLQERRYLKEEIVFDEGEEGQTLYIVLRGSVLICRQGEPDTGRVAEIPQGSLFGELALLDGAPRSAQARAAEDCVLASLSRADFQNLIETHAAIASKIAYQLARELGHKMREGRDGLAIDRRPL
jgi:CRP-like cAMP-binding protein